MIEGMNIKVENVWTEGGTKSVVVTWNLAERIERSSNKKISVL